uniref:HMG box domain-containing protein n=1 Tax=Caenorhabditis tropicalis TaxID=1561998 RepID=A0A1I7UV02_9PELO
MDIDTRTSSTSASPAVMSSSSVTPSSGSGLEGRSGSLGHMTVMSYDIWKAKCASEKKRLEDERAKKCILDPFNRSPSPTPMRKRAHTFVAPPTKLEEIPLVAPKKMSVDEKGKGKYILLPTIPAMRIFVNEVEEAPPAAQAPLPIAPVPMPITTSVMDIPSTSSARPPFPPAPILAPTQLSPFKPVLPSQPPMVSNLSTEQSLSSLILHNSVLQQQQQNSLQDLLGGQTIGQVPDVLSMLRLQQQAATLAAALQAAGVQIPITQIPSAPLPMMQKTLPTTLTNQTFLQSPLFTNPV